jgi:hypothetical protein
MVTLSLAGVVVAKWDRLSTSSSATDLAIDQLRRLLLKL